MKDKVEDKKSSLVSRIFAGIRKVIYFFIWLFIIVSIIKLIDFNFSSKITAYSVNCKEKPIGNYCKDPDYTSAKTIYTVNKKRQEVISKSEGFSHLFKYTDCAVIDTENWNCKADDGSWEFGFSDGRFQKISYTDSNYVDKRYDVSRLGYIKVICKDIDGVLWFLCMAGMNLFE